MHGWSPKANKQASKRSKREGASELHMVDCVLTWAFVSFVAVAVTVGHDAPSNARVLLPVVSSTRGSDEAGEPKSSAASDAVRTRRALFTFQQ